MARLFNDEEERHMVTQYISHLIQQPDIRPSFHILLTSDTGCGKGFLYSEILRPLLANQTMLINTYNRLTSQFSSVLDSNLLLFLDDCKAKSESTMTMIKSLMTESTQCIEEKGYQQKMVNSYTRFILASNSKRPLVIAANERRWYAPKYITHKLNLLETQKFIETVSNWLLLPDSLPAIYNYLAGFDIADFNPKHCKRTDTLLQMIEWSCNPINAVLNDFLENKLYFTFKDVQDHLETSGYKSVKNSVVTDSLRQQDYESKRIKNPNTKKLETYWMKSGCDSACIDFSSSL